MMSNQANLHLWPRQYRFVQSPAFETLYGGAAGGGKTAAQIIDAFLYAARYRGSRQIIFRRYYTELEMSIMEDIPKILPVEELTFNRQEKVYRLRRNGSVIRLGYIARNSDVTKYQSAQFDVIRFDELTHFTEYQYTYMRSRCRGANPYPKAMKSSTNPGGVGHSWVKRMFIDPAPPDTLFEVQCLDKAKPLSRIFIPARVQDNGDIMQYDRDYIRRLQSLPEAERRTLLDGDWNVFEGQYFSEFNYPVHVIEPFNIPSHWRRYRVFDYGLDRLACLWIAVDPSNNAYVYREYCRSDLPIWRAAKDILEHTPQGENIYITLAPPDIWGREQSNGRRKADMFAENGLPLVETSADREAGWLSIRELLRCYGDKPRLQIFSTCTELIQCLPMLVRDPLKPTDCMTEPHEITHAPDALRYFCVYWHTPAPVNPQSMTSPDGVYWYPDQWDDYLTASPDERARMVELWGKPRPR